MELTEIAQTGQRADLYPSNLNISSVERLYDAFCTSYSNFIEKSLLARKTGQQVKQDQFLFTEEQLANMGFRTLQNFERLKGVSAEGFPIYLDARGYNLFANLVSLTHSPDGPRYIVEITGIRKE